MATVILIVSLAGVAYIYLGYPALIWLLSRFWPRGVRKQSAPADMNCSVVIAVYREGHVLQRKIESILESTAVEYVREIVIGFDGQPGAGDPSPEELGAISRTWADRVLQGGRRQTVPEVRVMVFPERRGKASVLNDIVPQTRSGVLIMMDARQMVHPEAIGELLVNFVDEKVGVVSGELVFRSTGESCGGGAAQRGVGFYWRYEKFIRRCEAKFRSVPGATGALYAIRRELFHPIPSGTLLDDVAIPMQAVASGCRCIFEPLAEVYDAPSVTAGQEAVRKRRTITGVAQLMRLYPEWLLPWRNPIWFEYVSHKILRLVSPLLLIVLLADNLMLLDRPVFRLMGVLQVLFYLVALTGMVAQRCGWKAGFAGIPMMFVSLNVTTALALWDAVRGRYEGAWRK